MSGIADARMILHGGHKASVQAAFRFTLDLLPTSIYLVHNVYPSALHF